MRISCCASMYNGQCNDCPLTAPIRPTELMPGPSQQEAIDAAYERAAQVCDERSAKTQVFYMQSKKTALVAEYWFGASDEARQNAERIRALKGKP